MMTTKSMLVLPGFNFTSYNFQQNLEYRDEINVRIVFEANKFGATCLSFPPFFPENVVPPKKKIIIKLGNTPFLYYFQYCAHNKYAVNVYSRNDSYRTCNIKKWLFVFPLLGWSPSCSSHLQSCNFDVFVTVTSSSRATHIWVICCGLSDHNIIS